MNTFVTPRAARARFKIGLVVLTGSLGCAMAAGAAANDDVPRLASLYATRSKSG